MNLDQDRFTPFDALTSRGREDLVYSHNFKQYFGDGDQQINRLDQILRFGIVSPKKAQQLDIPYYSRHHIFIAGARNYDNIIFLFSAKHSKDIPFWDDAVTILLSSGLRVVNNEEMRKYQRGGWHNFSYMNGEVYRFGKIDQRFFKEIILPTDSSDSLEKVRTKIKEYLPALSDQIKVRGRV